MESSFALKLRHCRCGCVLNSRLPEIAGENGRPVQDQDLAEPLRKRHPCRSPTSADSSPLMPGLACFLAPSTRRKPSRYGVGKAANAVGTGVSAPRRLRRAVARGDLATAFHEAGGFRREVQPRRQHWFLNEKSGFPFRTPAFCSVSRGQRRLGEEEYRAPSVVTPGVALRPRTQGRPRRASDEASLYFGVTIVML
jgi:hypothetical protein